MATINEDYVCIMPDLCWLDGCGIASCVLSARAKPVQFLVVNPPLLLRSKAEAFQALGLKQLIPTLSDN